MSQGTSRFHVRSTLKDFFHLLTCNPLPAPLKSTTASSSFDHEHDSPTPNSLSPPDPWLSGHIVSVFQSVVVQNANEVAISSLHGVLNYSTFNSRANQLARTLRTLGVVPGKVVAVKLPRGAEFIICIMAIWKAGGVLLPVNCSMPKGRTEFMFSDCTVEFLISTEKIIAADPLENFLKPTLYLDNTETILVLGQQSSEDLEILLSFDDLAYIIYTSGTAGNPKGVTTTHGSLLNTVAEIRNSKEITSCDRVLMFAPFCFDASLRDICGALLTGAILYVPKSEEILPGHLLETLRRQRISYAVITPTVLRSCKYETLPDLHTLGVAGEASDQDLIKLWGAGRTIINLYGPTEAAVCCTKMVYHNGFLAENMPVTIGRPNLNCKIYILDQHRAQISDGEVGEIYIGGQGVSKRGYLNLPTKTSQCFFDNPFHAGRMYKSGDLGKFLPNGEIQYLGRIDGQIKLNGRRIEVEEIEACLRTAFTVHDAAVTVRGTEGRSFLAAYIIPSDAGKTCERDQLASFLKALVRSHLPSYSVPSSVSFVETWPMSMAQKILKDALPDPFEILSSQKRKHSQVSQISVDLEDILSETELKVAKIMCEMLKVPIKAVKDPQTTYMDLGGSSLFVATMVRQLNHLLGSTIRVATFYSSGASVSGISAVVDGIKAQDLDLFDTNLQNLVYLPSDIVPPPRILQSAKTLSPERILVTGATGFFGSHILSELLSSGSGVVLCVVRETDSETAAIRVEKSLQSWGLWEEEYRERIHAIAGDTGKPFLGMDPVVYETFAQSITQIWHCAAGVNFLASYQQLEDVTVKGTIEVLRFASTFVPKKVIYISTLAVFFGAEGKLTCGSESSSSTLGEAVITGYAQTKWVAEQLVEEFQRRGGQAIIMRPGRLLGSTTRGQCPILDLTMCLLRSFIEIGVAPEIAWSIDFTPIDICTRMAVLLASQEDSGPFHLINPQSITLGGLVGHMNTCGFDIQIVPYSEWKHRITASKELAPLLSFFNEPFHKGRSFFEILLDNTCFRESSYEIQRTEAALAGRQIWGSLAYEDLLPLYIKSLGKAK